MSFHTGDNLKSILHANVLKCGKTYEELIARDREILITKRIDDEMEFIEFQCQKQREFQIEEAKNVNKLAIDELRLKLEEENTIELEKLRLMLEEENKAFERMTIEKNALEMDRLVKEATDKTEKEMKKTLNKELTSKLTDDGKRKNDEVQDAVE